MQVRLNSRNYEVVGRRVRRNGRDILVPVEEYDVELFTQSFDTLGGQSQERIGPYTSRIFPNSMLGFGRDLVASDSARNLDEYRRFFDATFDTRFEKTYLPILEENSTETGLEVVRAFANFKGDFWSIWDDDTSTDVVARKYTGSTTTWEGGGNVLATAVTITGLDVIAHKTRLVALIANEDDHIIRVATDGVTWSAASTPITTGLLLNNVSAHEDINAGLLTDVGGEIIAVLWDETSGTITFFSTADASGTWKDEAIDIPSGDGPHGVAVYPGIDGEDKLYVLAMEGLWEVDTAPDTWTFRMIFPTPGGIAVFGRRMMVGDDGALWFSVGVDDDTPAAFYRMVVSGDSRVITPVGLNLGDGVSSDMLGPVHYMTSAGGFQWASIGGGKASRNARVIAWNGKGWHSMRRHGTANQKIEAVGISGRDDNLVRLHYSVRTGAAVSNTKLLGQPLVNPASGVSIKRETSGFIDLPYIDGGMPLIPGIWLQVGINSEDTVGTDDEYFAVTDGRDDGVGGLQVRTFNTVGDFFKSTNTVKLGAEAGVSSANYGLRITGHRDTDTTVNVDSVTTNVQSTGGVTSATFAHTCAGANRLLTVLVSAQDNGSTNQIPTGVTYNAVALTKLGDAVTGSNGVGASIWYLVAPATGANNVIVTFASSVNSWVIGAVSVFNNAQTSPVGSMVTDNATGTAPSVTVTASNDDLVIDVLAAQGTSQTATVGAGQTERWNLNLLPLTPARIGAASTEAATGNVTMSWTLSVSDDYVLLGVALKTVGSEINTNTPVLKDVEVNYLKIPPTLEGYIFTVDVKQSTGTDGQVISDLKAARDLSTLPILVYGPSGNRFVKVRNIRWLPEVTEGSVQRGGAPDALMQRGGYWEVTCEEVI